MQKWCSNLSLLCHYPKVGKRRGMFAHEERSQSHWLVLRLEKQDGQKRAASCHLLSIPEQDFGPCWHFDLLRGQWKVYRVYSNKSRCKRFNFIWQDQAGHWSHAWRHCSKLTWSDHEEIQGGQVQSTLCYWCRFQRSGHSKCRLGHLNRATQRSRDLHS